MTKKKRTIKDTSTSTKDDSPKKERKKDTPEKITKLLKVYFEIQLAYARLEDVIQSQTGDAGYVIKNYARMMDELSSFDKLVDEIRSKPLKEALKEFASKVRERANPLVQEASKLFEEDDED